VSHKTWDMLQLRRTCLENIEETKDQIILREKPHYLFGTAFCALAVFFGSYTRSSWTSHNLPESLVISCFPLFAGAMGLYGSVQSTLKANHKEGTLRVERKLGWFRFERCFLAKNISRVFERKTLKGNGLAVELSSGISRGLTLFTEYSALSGQAGALDHLLQAARHNGCQSHTPRLTPPSPVR